eukprot:TRINITY_DN17440_c0_g2_i1.p1 TRINITY_DN17440_c0_g2~~TRINITY_DN17440_c0_g2_i1.p1  ORF type:complete len:171 (-),score=52.16 TRINITY_DN17440_c0_g2_i1:8-520(-)
MCIRDSTWGCSADGQLGRPGQPGARFDGLPRPMEDEAGVQPKGSQVACGFTHTLLLTPEGDVLACGSNLSGQLGLLGEYNCQMHPAAVPCFEGKKCLAIAAGREHSLVLTSKNEVVGFGCGLSGQLGVGSDVSSNACHGGPVVVEMVSGAARTPSVIAAAGDFSACITTR